MADPIRGFKVVWNHLRSSMAWISAVAVCFSGCSTLEYGHGFALGLTQPVQLNENAAPAGKMVVAAGGTKSPADFQPETLYDLLVAELAAYEHHFDLTVKNYLQQAHQTQDPGLAERAYGVAAAINARESARSAANLWLDLEPHNPRAIQAKAVEQILAGSIEEALPALAEVRSKTGEAPFLLVAAQVSELTDNVRDRLIGQLRAFNKQWPGDITIKISLAVLLQHQGDLEAALAQLDLVPEHGDYTAMVMRLKGQLLGELGHLGWAVSILKTGVETFPDDLRMRLLLGSMLVKNRDLIAALHEFEVLVSQQPNNPELLTSVGLMAMENGMPGLAGLYFQQLSQIPGRADEAHYHMGRIAQQMDDWQGGRKHFRQVKPGAHFIPAYAALVRMLSDQDRWEEAVEDLEQARAAYQEYAPHLYLVEGKILQDQRRYGDAFEVFNRALIKYPDEANLLYSRAMLAERLDDIASLEADLRAILAKDPDNVAALNALGYTLADRTERYHEAKELITRANQLQPDDPAILDSMGWVEYRLGNREAALDNLGQAYALSNDAEIAAHFGELLWVDGQRDRALKIWNDAQKRQPDSEVLQSTIERLQTIE